MIFKPRTQLRGAALACLAATSLTPALAAQADPVAPVAIAVQQPHWSDQAARDLLDAVRSAKAEGLDPRAYDPSGLERAIAAGEGEALDQAAATAALAVARDFWLGRVQDRQRFDWHIERSPYAAAELPARLAEAVAQDQVGPWLKSLLPQTERYAALRTALADAPDTATRDRLRANLERMRWLPRDLGQDYLLVNIPSYKLAVVQGGTPVSYYTVVVGAKDTPTPMMSMAATSIVVNPWWNVPQSIVAKSNLRPSPVMTRKGFVFARADDGGWTVKQKPGPGNSLGRIKIDMPNDQAIYFHDTNARALFARDERALSHGCIRVKDIAGLASELSTADGSNAGMVEAALAGDDTQRIALAKKWPVYLIYLTADMGDDGRVVSYSDPYDRDAALVRALDGSSQLASLE